MTAAIHQPNFLPWPGFFYKWWKSDILVLLDDVQFIKRSTINRVKIKGPAGQRWLTVPVIQKGRYYQRINEVEIRQDALWQKKLLGSVEACYARAPYFKKYFPPLAAVLGEEFPLLVDLNIKLLGWAALELGIKTEMKRSSLLEGIIGQSSQRLASICRAVGAKRYLSGFGGQKYQDETIFTAYDLELEVYDFTLPVYSQLWGEFIPGLSILDLLFNCGPKSKEILCNSAAVHD